MLVGGPSARAFGLRIRGGIPMEAAQTNVYHAPVSRASTTRSIRIHTIHSLAKNRGAPRPLQKFQSALDAQR